jgi:hypothetical protein
MKMGDMGFWEVADEATHRFALRVEPESDAVRRRRAEFWALACDLFPELTNTVHLLEEAIKVHPRH